MPNGPPTTVDYGQAPDDSSQGPGSNSLDSGQGDGWGGYGAGGGMWASGSTGGYTVNPNTFAGEINAANQSARGYYNQGANWQQAAPTVTDPFAAQVAAQYAASQKGQSELAAQLQRVAQNGYAGPGVQQYDEGVRAAAQSQAAVANSAGGGAIGASGARRAAQQANAVAGSGAFAGQALAAAGAQQAAQSQLSGVLGAQGQLAAQNYGLGSAQATAQAQLQQQQMGLGNTARLGFYGLSANEQGQAVGAETGLNNAILGLAGASSAQQSTNNQYGNALVGMGLQGASGIAQAVGSQMTSAAPAAGPTESDLENPYYSTP